jgi:hypothetical protein
LTSDRVAVCLVFFVVGRRPDSAEDSELKGELKLVLAILCLADRLGFIVVRCRAALARLGLLVVKTRRRSKRRLLFTCGRSVRAPPPASPIFFRFFPVLRAECSLTKGLSVLCFTFNKQNQDLIAAGYGSTEFGKTTNGLILFWSLKNPKFPHKAIKTKHSITSLDFGTEHPHLLAAGNRCFVHCPFFVSHFVNLLLPCRLVRRHRCHLRSVCVSSLAASEQSCVLC